MCEFLDSIEEKGFKKGFKQGFEQGRLLGISLVQYLIINNRMEDLEKALKDMEYCKKLIEELPQKKKAVMRMKELRAEFMLPADFDPDRERAEAREAKYGSID